MDKEDWKLIEKELSENIYSKIKLNCDDHIITIRREINNNKLVFFVYVDNWFKGEYMKVESKIGKKFYSPKTQWKYRPSRYKELQRIFGKRRSKKDYGENEKVLICYMPYFNSFRSLKSKLIKTCKSIKLINE